MILLDNINSFETSLQSKNEFRIKTTAKTFKILSDGLYSNKIKSIIRELSCNAYDSHIASNKKEIPFYVKFPTLLDKVFMVKDFGIGLSDDDINNIYTTYFESSKNNSNDFIGALGLGSKSPFSYTDTFNVISIHNKIKSFYCASLIDGIPNILLINQENTEEENGVSIFFDVKNEDFGKFEKYGKEVFETFETRPDTNIDLDYTFYDNSFFLKFDDYVFRNESRNKISLIQGNVSYDINKDLINIPENVKKIYYNSNRCFLEINFNIGDLEVSPSRESLSFDNRTIDNINKKLKILDEKLSIEIQKNLDTSHNFITFLNKIDLFLYNNNAIFSKYINSNNLKFNNNVIDLKERLEIIPDKNNKYDFKLYTTYSKKKYLFGKYIELLNFVNLKNENFCILYRDRTKGVNLILKELLLKYKNVFIYEGDKEFLNILEKKLCAKNENIENNLIEEKLNIFYLSSFKIKNNSNNTKIYKSSSMAKYTSDGFYSLDEQEVLPDGKKYYVKIYGKIPVKTFENIEKKFFVNDLQIIYKEMFKKEINNIYGIRKNIINEIEKDKNWINLYDYVFENLKNYSFYEITKYEINLNLTDLKIKFLKYISENSNNKSFKTFIKTFDDFYNENTEKIKNKTQYILFIKSIININKNDCKYNDLYQKYIKTKDLKRYYDKLMKKYPLIKMYTDNCLLGNSYYEYKDFTNKENIYVKDLINYINTKEKKGLYND